jgi:linoleoyl-CoA desaturase
MNTTTPIFSKEDNLKFFRTLNKRVNDYFKENKINKTGNWKLHLKTIVMFGLFLTPYFFLLAKDMPFWVYLLLNVVIGIGMAGVGMNVMHDGNHGAYSTKSCLKEYFLALSVAKKVPSKSVLGIPSKELFQLPFSTLT